MKTAPQHLRPVEEIDLHVVVILILLLVLGLSASFHVSYYWCLILTGIVPQGVILTRALGDRRRPRRPWLSYLLSNESLVVACVALQALASPVPGSA